MDGMPAPADPAATLLGLCATGGLAWAVADLFGGMGGFTDRQLLGLLRRAEVSLPDLPLDAAGALDRGLRRAQQAATRRLLADYAAAVPEERPFVRRLRRALARARAAPSAFPLTAQAERLLGQLLALPETEGPASARLAATAQAVEGVVLRYFAHCLYPPKATGWEEDLPASFVSHLRGGRQAPHPRWLELFGAALLREYRADRRFRTAVQIGFGAPFGAAEALLPPMLRWRKPLLLALGGASLVLLVGLYGQRTWNRVVPIAERVVAERLPSACDVQEWTESSGVLGNEPDRIGVLVTRLQGDPDGRASARLTQGFAEDVAFEVASTCRPAPENGASPAAIRAGLGRSGALLLTTGGMEGVGEYLIDFVTPQPPPAPVAGPFRLAGPILDDARAPARITGLRLVAIANLPRGEEARLRAAAADLQPRLPVFERLLVAPPIDFHAGTRVDLGLRFAEALSRMAEASDSIPLFTKAVDRWTWMARRLDREAEPALWARSQLGLGRSLVALAPWEPRASLLGAAAEAFRAALVALSETETPLEWALTQAGLGSALAGLGQSAPSVAPLRDAVAAYRAALGALPRSGMQVDVAMIQSSFGDALRMLGERERNAGLLQEAVAQHRAALDALPDIGMPEQRAQVQVGLAQALWRLGLQDRRAETMAEAVDSFRAALTGYAPETRPLAWGATQVELGNVLRTQAASEPGVAKLGEAAAAYRAALQGWTRERLPRGWAATQASLGQTMVQIAERERAVLPLEQAVAAFRAALEEWTPDKAPEESAMVHNSLGLALWRLGELEGGTPRLEAAATAFRATLDSWRRENVPQRWAQTQNNLGNVLLVLGARQSGTQRLIEAVNAYRAALEVQQRASAPLAWAMTQNNLAVALWMLGQRESGPARLAEAETAFLAALEERSEFRVPLDWASSRFNLALVRETLAVRGERTALLESALADCEAALATFRRLGAQEKVALATDLRDRIALKLGQ